MIKRLEKAYGINIELDFYNKVKYYKIYTADGCMWENGLTYQQLLKEIKENRENFLKIKNKVLTK